MKIGILGTSDIAFRRFLPALKKCDLFTYAGVASRTPEKGKKFQETYGGRVYESYNDLLADETIDAVYVPLPPALHYQWGKKVLESGKHLLMEKPFTTNLRDTDELLKLAEEKGLAVHENYMFLYHSQLRKIKEMIADGSLGEIRLYRMSFGFPMRDKDDFRYKKGLGGGALLDCGGYPIRLASELLGETAKVTQARLIQPVGFEVDLYGNAVLENQDGQAAQISFGMDNAYQCQLEVWGSRITLIASRVFTAGADVTPTLLLRSSRDEKTLTLEKDDQFFHSIEHFVDCIQNCKIRALQYESVSHQGQLVEFIMERE